MAKDDLILPKLREDLELCKGPSTIEGFPTWSLYDPCRNQYFRIGWLEFEMLSRWPQGSAQNIIDDINASTTLHATLEQLKDLIQFLNQNTLLQLPPQLATQQLQALHQASQKKSFGKLFRQYLFFRFPLFKPDRFLEKTLPIVKPLFNQTFFMIMIMLGIFSLYLIGRQWEQFIHTFSYFFNWHGLIYIIITILFSKAVHELAHAYTAKYFGSHVNNIGIMLIVFWPVMFTDTTDAWRLTNHRQRMAIDAAGIISELMLAVFATLAWTFLPDGPLRSAMFFLATVSWFFSLFINLNPCIRFDGYYLFADFLDIPNLQKRGFSLAKWRLRELLFGIKEPKPQHFNSRTHKIVLAYAYATWIYRFFMFIGIAIIIYHMLFKALAIIIVSIQITLFLIKPIISELHQYWQRRKKMTWNKNTITTAITFSLMLWFLLVPWRTVVDLPATLSYAQDSKIYIPEASRVKQVEAKENQHVTKGQLLLALQSPQLDNEIKQVKYDINLLQYRMQYDPLRSNQLGHQQADKEELLSKQSELKILKDQQQQLNIIAPFSGKISYVTKGLNPNRWLSINTYALEITNENDYHINAFIQEKDLNRIKLGNTGFFYPNNPDISKIKAQVIKIETTGTQRLTKPYLASIYGGDIAVNTHNEQLKLNEAMFRVTLAPIKQQQIANFSHITTGTMQLKGQSESIIRRIWLNIYTLLIRESGF